MIKQQGIVTLTLLLLLSSLLLILMLLDDDILRFYSATTAQRKYYIEQTLALQQRSQAEKNQACENLSLENSLRTQKIIFEHNEKQDHLIHTVWCQRQFLFKQSPNKASFEGGFENFIDKTLISHFSSQLSMPPSQLKNRTDYIFWFDKNHNQWELNSNIYAVVIAEGDLTITGKGQISGTVITGGKLITSETITLAYRSALVTKMVRQFSRWQLAEKSWYDFTPL